MHLGWHAFNKLTFLWYLDLTELLFKFGTSKIDNLTTLSVNRKQIKYVWCKLLALINKGIHQDGTIWYIKWCGEDIFIMSSQKKKALIHTQASVSWTRWNETFLTFVQFLFFIYLAPFLLKKDWSGESRIYQVPISIYLFFLSFFICLFVLLFLFLFLFFFNITEHG